uniref:Huntingtin n=1 Tax=Sinocyclocheilus rhinocerous TaxID=307959 RepID=A0A673IMQ9_9TELE
MATMEKLMKAFESLKSFQQQQGPLSAEELVQKQKKDLATTKKDRVTHCLTICENIVAQSLRTSPEFQKLLGIAMEMFLLCSDDKESDVRMVADECLNKIIKALMDSNLPRLQLELYKEIKKVNRIAFSLFDLNVFSQGKKNCLGFPLFLDLMAFVANLKSSSPTIRRTAASSAVSVCQHSRRTHYFYTWLLNVLLSLVVPVDEEHSSHLILGVLLSLRYLMPLLQQQAPNTSLKGSFGLVRKEADITPTPEQLIQVYELTLHYTQHWDHNVVTASLELLQQVFRTPPPELLNALITRGKISHTSVFREETECRARSGSILELIGKYFYYTVSGGSTCSPLLLRKQKGDLSALLFSSEAPSSSGVSSLGTSDIITEQPRSSQHALQPGDSVDLSASEQGVGPDTPDEEDEEDMLSRSSSGGAGVVSTSGDLVTDGNQMSMGAVSSPPSDSSQTTTEGPDSAVTPSDCAELVLDGSDSQYSGMQIGTLQDEEEEGAAPPPDKSPEPFSQSALALSKPHLLEGKGHNRQSSDSSVDRFIPKEEVLEPAELDNSPPSRIKGDIGHYTDPKEEPLVHCVRLLAASFLLTGQRNGLVPDNEVRVSVKALAVSCVGAAATLLPEAFFNKLYLQPLEGQEPDEQQYISDILQYIEHGDPQIRGATAILCGALIQAIQLNTRYNTETWLSQIHSFTGNSMTLENFVPLLQRSLKDESSVTCKMACAAIRHCIMALCSGSLSELGLQLLIDLLTLKDCSYWLVRTELLETLAEIDFRLVSFLERKTEKLHKGEHHYTGLLRLQDRVLNDVVLYLLSDEDPRVRHVAANTISRLVPRLFFDCDQAQTDPVVAIARDQSSVYLQLLMHETQPPSQFTVSTITRTYRGYSLGQSTPDVTVENNLSRVIAAISHALTSSTSRATTFGCCEALCLLSSTFPVCTWSTGWHCGFVCSSVFHLNRSSQYRSRGRSFSLSQPCGSEDMRRSLTVGVASMVLSLISSAWFPLDLSAHQAALLLAGNLLAAVAPKCMKSPWAGEEESNPTPSKVEEAWSALNDRSLVVMVEQLFSHLLKILNICAHVLDDTPPGPAVKATLPSLGNTPSLSPIRRKGKEKEMTEPSTTPMSPKKGGEANTATPAVNKSTTLGSFYHLPPYLKLYDALRATHANYKVTLDLHNTNEKFGSFLRSALDVLSQLLEMATLHDIGKCVEEILGYLKSCFSREPTMATVCVQQLLKALFGTNLASQYEGASSHPCRSQGKALRLGSTSVRPGLYHYCFMAPYTHFTQALADASLRNMVQAEQEQDASGWFDVMQKVSNQLRSSITNVTRHRGDKNAIHNHIRLFEPLVIKALKQYTTSTSVALQRQVLDLLTQLVQLRVNYCLLDSDQVFIGFVLKQFEYIEVGQFRHSEEIVPNIFFFLVLLSYERYHSKQIISIPKIIQLCDGIMASDRKAVTHAIPALQPIVHDLFVLRGSNKADAGKELDTQKEVVVSMLLRLIQHHQVLEMFILVLQQCHKENEDKWKRLSRQISDIILPMIGKQQMHLDSHEALGVLNTLFETVAPSSLRPVDMLLKSMFITPSTLASACTVQLWVSGILAILRVLISQSTEDIILSRIQELSLSPYLLSCPTIGRLCDDDPSPPEAPPTTMEDANEEPQRVPPEETFARFLLQLVGVLLDDIATKQVKVDMSEQQHTFYCQQLGTMLMCLIHIFKSGMFRRITAAGSRLLKAEEEEGGNFYALEGLNSLVLQLITTHPSLVLLWCQVLLIINYTNYTWWSEVHQTPRRHSLSSTKLLSPHSSGEEERPEGKLAMCNREIVRRGALILFCDYVCQNLHDSEHLTWLTVNHVSDLISLSHEPPVQDLISAVHRNSAASGLFIQAIQSRCDNLSTPVMLKKTLQCLEGIHLSQSGALLMLYVDKLLNTPFRVLARMVDTLACRRVEMLLAETLQNSIAQLPLEELDRIQQYLQTSGLAQRHQRFYSLLDRFRATVAEDTTSPAAPITSHPLDGNLPPPPEYVEPNKDWYVALVKSQCCLRREGALYETTELLTKLPQSDLNAIMTCKDFNLCLLASCLSVGVQRVCKNHGKVIFDTAQQVAFERLAGVIELLPSPHQTLLPSSKMCADYWQKLNQVYMLSLCGVLSQYLLSLSKLPSSLHIPKDKETIITTFSTLAIEVVVWRLLQDQLPLSVDMQMSLSCLCLALQQPAVWTHFASHTYLTHTCSIVHCIQLLIHAVAVGPGDQLLTPERKTEQSEDQLDSADKQLEWRCCEIMAELVEGLQSVLALGHHRNKNIPAFLTPTLRNVIISLARLPIVNSYTRIPPLVWKLGWSPRPSGEFGTALPEIPVEFLQEKDVFREFLYRINTLGMRDKFQSLCLYKSSHEILRYLTESLISSLHHSKMNTIKRITDSKDICGAMMNRRDFFKTHLKNLTDPKLLGKASTTKYSTMLFLTGAIVFFEIQLEHQMHYGIFASSLCNGPLNYQHKVCAFYMYHGGSRKHRAGVDIHSCSQFLLELYSQWILPGSPSSKKTPVVLLSEVVRSLLAVSDLFTERNQFDMMFSTLTELQKVHPPEDEILNQYLVPAICKAAAVLGMDKAIAEPVCRLLESTLRSTHLPSRIAALHGVLYVLECDLLDDTARQLIPTVNEYLLSNLRAIAQCVNLHNQQHVLVMCAVAFYMMENYPLDVGSEFNAGIIQLCCMMLSASEEATPSIIYHCILRGLERLLLSEQLSRVDAETLVKLSVERVNMPSPHRAMAALGLMLTCMYTGKEKGSPGRPVDADPTAPDSESVIVAMERVSVLFDRIRKGFPSEVRVVSRILPQFLDDFFPLQDVMNKVIGEFLSNQQPYPQFMATVVYKVFQTLHATGQSSMVRDWVLLSLSNFTQRTPVAMAMWSLSCFFVSASTSQWISALLPHVISRMGKSDTVDISLFCLVAMDFYRHQIDEELDRRAFQTVFEMVASPGSPYYQLLCCLQSIHQDTSL